MYRQPANGHQFPDAFARLGPIAACALAGVAILAALAARILLDPVLGDRAAFLFFVPAVLVAAALAGLITIRNRKA